MWQKAGEKNSLIYEAAGCELLIRGALYFPDATSIRDSARCSASNARSTSTEVSPLVKRCSARSLALRARSTSISEGRSAVSARIVTLFGSTSAKPQATAVLFGGVFAVG